MRIIRRTKFQSTIDAAVERLGSSCVFKLPFDRNGRDYYRAVQGEGLEDYTFALEHEGNVLCVVECDNSSEVLGRFGFPIEAWLDSTLPYDLRRQAIIDICAELQRLAIEHKLQKIHFRSATSTDPDGYFLGYLLRHGARPALELRAVVDLSLSEQFLFGNLRKGHRQQVRWGNANLSWSFVDSLNPNLDEFESYRAFHAEIAGRVTRSPESWTAMYRAIVAGRGDLVLGHYDGKLVSGTLVLDGSDTAYYASGVYQRELFDKPLGHAAVFSGILRAKARGCRTFDVGELKCAGSADAEKEAAISYFKEGFTSRTETSVVLTWR